MKTVGREDDLAQRRGVAENSFFVLLCVFASQRKKELS